MTIEIHQPELEALIQQHMAGGHFRSVEDLLRQTLEAAPLREAANEGRPRRSGLALLEVMQTMPHREVDIEPPRAKMCVRDVTL